MNAGDRGALRALHALDARIREEWVDLYHDLQGSPAYGPALVRFEELQVAIGASCVELMFPEPVGHRLPVVGAPALGDLRVVVLPGPQVREAAIARWAAAEGLEVVERIRRLSPEDGRARVLVRVRPAAGR